ncbi:N-acetylglucosamine-6-phosphate deacetylase isoform X2 [Lutra lutra]|uniref:N-acetylglucosamine-6-phosphate deacetylase isoform X2 n=1 Tax=Lutra lutra TaxID=9657 RepID=UPI001FD556D8|nr:N-acetylglucosamine-6-phosphate deacetylase isoform X2 [Lutra lutra]
MSSGTAGAASWRPASSTCRSTVDLALTSLRPRRTWARGSPWWPRGSCRTESPPSAPPWSPHHPRFITRAPCPLPSPRSFVREVWASRPGCLSGPEMGHVSTCYTRGTFLMAFSWDAVLPQIPVKSGGPHGAGVLGVHLEGPFISREKRGAHPEAHLRSFEANAFHDVLTTYGALDNVRIVTLAPELGRSREVIRALVARGICVSLGHSVADLQAAEEAVQCGATFITHLFNAMLPFHHRDPGIVGLLTSDRLPPGRHIFYGMIADGTHTNPAALRIAHRALPQGLVLVTDAVPALGLGDGRHTLGQQEVEVDGLTAYVAGTKTLSGSIAPMDVCVRHFLQATGCSVELALEAASLHPAQLLGLEKRKGTLDFGADADFVVLDDSLHVRATYISGELVWQAEEARQ